jgi:hypothetical protein
VAGSGHDRQRTTGSAKPRDHAECKRFLTGWSLVEPGVVWLSQWQPDPDDEVAVDPVSGGWAGVARKPS